MSVLERLVVVSCLCTLIVGCSRLVPEKIEVRTPDLDTKNFGANAGQNLLNVREMQSTIQARDQTIQELKDRIRELIEITTKQPPTDAVGDYKLVWPDAPTQNGRKCSIKYLDGIRFEFSQEPPGEARQNWVMEWSSGEQRFKDPRPRPPGFGRAVYIREKGWIVWTDNEDLRYWVR